MNRLLWLLVASTGALGWGVLALHRGETVSAAWLVLAAVTVLCLLVGAIVFTRNEYLDVN